MASIESQKPKPSPPISAPVKTHDILICGANHTVNSRPGVPYRRSVGTGAMPCVSTDRSPARLGVRPVKGEALSAVAGGVIPLFDHEGRFPTASLRCGSDAGTRRADTGQHDEGDTGDGG